MKITLSLLVICLVCVSAQEIDCPFTECFCTRDVLYCNSLKLTSIPHDIRNISVVRCLYFSDNRISTVPAGRLPANLTTLSFVDNPIETIDVNAFDESLNTLETLKFSSALFTKIPDPVFNLISLKSLSISETFITSWDESSMKKLGSSIETLFLDTVGLTEWPSWIQHFSQLTDLTIAGNSISLIPDDALNFLANKLTSLALNNNSFDRVPKALSNLTALTMLNLQENNISDTTWLPHKSKINQLLLDNNKIADANNLSSSLLFYADSLSSFGIQYNLLTAIPNVTFLSRIDTFEFSNNRLSDIDSGSFQPGVRGLFLDHNNFPSIPRVMKSLKFVPTLILNVNNITLIRGEDFLPSTSGAQFGYNLITELTKSCFPENSSIAFLFVNNNPLYKISDDAFDNVPALDALYLQHTKLTRLPMAIKSLNYLYKIDVTGSSDLVCTCLEKNLESIIKSLTEDMVVGDCGQTSLYKFFASLSSNCPPVNDLFSVLKRR